MNYIPLTFPATGQDWFNYAARYGISNYLIQAVLHFDGKLDFERLNKAVRLSADIEPVLGCRFVEGPEKPYWQRLKSLNDFQWCLLEETEEREDAIQKYLSETMDMDREPQVKTKLIRNGESDTLCIKLNHASCDGGSVKYYLGLLAEIYSNPNFPYVPNTERDRDQVPLFEALGIKNPLSVWNPAYAQMESTWTFSCKNITESETPNVAVKRISAGDFKSMVSYARQKEATVNDLILTACFRTLFSMVKPLPESLKEIAFTVDLRRYLPADKRDGIANLSGMENAVAAVKVGESFEDTLKRISLLMKGNKKNLPGLQSAVACEMMKGITFQQFLRGNNMQWQKARDTGKSTPMLSNMGVINPLKFGEIIVSDSFLVTPFFHAPAIMLGVSTYNEVMTLVVGYHEPGFDREDVNLLLKLIVNDLCSCC